MNDLAKSRYNSPNLPLGWEGPFTSVRQGHGTQIRRQGWLLHGRAGGGRPRPGGESGCHWPRPEAALPALPVWGPPPGRRSLATLTTGLGQIPVSFQLPLSWQN